MMKNFLPGLEKSTTAKSFFSNSAIPMVAMAIVFCTGCSKTKDTHGFWTIGDHRYSINYTSRADSAGYAVLIGKEGIGSSVPSNPNSIFLWFTQFPTKNSSYTIVAFDSTHLSLSDSQIGISGTVTTINPQAACSEPDHYSATGIASVDTWPWQVSANAQVDVVNGKINVMIPMSTTVYDIPCSGVDSLFVHGQYQEY
jgi:hypothetical protein